MQSQLSDGAMTDSDKKLEQIKVVQLEYEDK